MISLGEGLKLGKGVKAFKLEVRQDQECEQKIYNAGVELESSLEDENSLAHKVFKQLASFQTPKPAVTGAQDTQHSEK
jgi:hypothetical protein